MSLVLPARYSRYSLISRTGQDTLNIVSISKIILLNCASWKFPKNKNQHQGSFFRKKSQTWVSRGQSPKFAKFGVKRRTVLALKSHFSAKILFLRPKCKELVGSITDLGLFLFLFLFLFLLFSFWSHIRFCYGWCVSLITQNGQN